MHIPFYNPEKTYEENFEEGPFGAFADEKIYEEKRDPQYEFFGQKVYLPFGIPAGPLLNSNFCKAAFEKGFDICVYKTVRSDFYPCHPFPNVLAIHPKKDLTGETLKKPLVADTQYSQPLSITNSFGVPSKKPEVWQEDVKAAISYARKGQVLVLSFMGTAKENQTQDEFVEDYILTAKLAKETGAKVLETNLSCPNIGSEGLVCYNLETTEKVTKGIRKAIGNTPLVLKVGYYTNPQQLKKLAQIANEYANGIALINTMQATIINEKGQQALPGNNRLKSGICGSAILYAGLEMVKQLKIIKDQNSYTFSIDGVGGVTTPEDYQAYKDAGADTVMSATGAMWNPYLAKDIKEKYL